MKKPINQPKWAVCYTVGMCPNTWGWVESVTSLVTYVHYGEGAPIWDSKAWYNAFVKIFDTEAEAKKIVEDYRNSQEYDPR